MSLRVLLADESASIHKVFQMGLQDFGAEVKSVHNGLDVIEVAEKYQPHIIFADILLQKKNGYEVTTELSQHRMLNDVPVVLMWSSFMELDRKQFNASGAKGELEKPFDVEKMRSIIQSLVESTKSQQISSFLQFPSSITQNFVEEEKARQSGDTQTVESRPAPKKSQEMNALGQPMYNDSEAKEEEVGFTLEGEGEEVENDQEVEASSVFNTQAGEDEFDMYEVTPTGEPKNKKTSPPQPEPTVEHDEGEDHWQARPLNTSKPEDTTPLNSETDMDHFQSMDLGNEKKINLSDFLYQPKTQTQEHSRTNQEIQNVRIPVYQDDTVANVDVVSPAEKEAIIRSEVRAWLMGSMKKELPAMLEKIVREELNRILEQEMALKGSSPHT